MPVVEYFIRYKGERYDVGTRLRFKTGTASWAGILEGTIEIISHNVFYIRLTDGGMWKLSKVLPLENRIVEIVYPVYYQDPPVEYVRGIQGGPCPPEDQIFVGWIWYIAIMVIGALFKEALLIWVIASAVFFLWKNGFFNR